MKLTLKRKIYLISNRRKEIKIVNLPQKPKQIRKPNILFLHQEC